jgi:hypothetical protein
MEIKDKQDTEGSNTYLLKMTVFWEMTPCILKQKENYQYSRGPQILPSTGCFKDASSRFRHNVGKYMSD